MASKKELDYSKRNIEHRKKILLDRFVQLGYTFLDAGCGAGSYLDLFRKRNGYVVGLDIKRELCILSKKSNFDVVNGDIDYLPFKNESFDLVWASEVIEHVCSLAVFGELERVAREWIIATMPNPSGPNYRTDPSHRLSYTMSSLSTYLKNRKKWRYYIHGLGIEWPSAPKWLRIPISFKTLSFYFMFNLPWLAPTIGVIGHRLTY